MSIQRVEIRQTLGPISTVEVRQGPKGDHGDAGAVTNASVNAAIATDAAATRTSLGLGPAALLTGSATFSAGAAMVWGTSKTQTLSDIWAAPKYPRAIAFSGSLVTDQGTLTDHPVLRLYSTLSTGYGEYSSDGMGPSVGDWSLRYQLGTWKLSRAFAIPGNAIWTSEATTDPDPTKVTTWTPSSRAISGTPVLYSADIITNTTLGLAFTSDKAQIASASFVAGKAILWDTTPAATRSAMGITATGDSLVTAATPAAAKGALGCITKVLASDTSDVTSDTTYANRSTFAAFPVSANTSYRLDVFLLATLGAGGLKARITFPSVVADVVSSAQKFGMRTYWGQSFATPVTGDSTNMQAVLIADSAATTNGQYNAALFFRTGAIAGNVVFEWAQNSSNAAASKLLAGSIIDLEPKASTP